MEESTEGQAITPAAAEIGDINVLWGESSINHQTAQSQSLNAIVLRWGSVSGFAVRQDKKLLKSVYI